MKKLLCAALISQAAIIGANEIDLEKECVTKLLQIEYYNDNSIDLMSALRTEMPKEEFLSKLNEGLNKEKFREEANQTFQTFFSQDEVEELYSFLTSDTYKKFNSNILKFNQKMGLPLAQVFIEIIQPKAEQVEEAPNKIIVANDDNFDAIIKENKNVVVDVYATWCGPCKALAPILGELSNEHNGKHVFVKVDFDACPKLGTRFGVKSLPTLLFFKDGEQVHRNTGFASKEALEDLLRTHFDK